MTWQLLFLLVATCSKFLLRKQTTEQVVIFFIMLFTMFWLLILIILTCSAINNNVTRMPVIMSWGGCTTLWTLTSFTFLQQYVSMSSFFLLFLQCLYIIFKYFLYLLTYRSHGRVEASLLKKILIEPWSSGIQCVLFDYWWSTFKIHVISSHVVLLS